MMAGAVPASFAARIPLVSVEASYAERPTDGLPRVIDGQDASPTGWSVFPRTDVAHKLMVRTAAPVHAESFDLTLCFLSGLPKRYFGDFSISYTTDRRPSLDGSWQRLMPQRLSATGTDLREGGEGRLLAGAGDNMIADAVFQIRFPSPRKAVTGFMVEVTPFVKPGSQEPRVSWNEYRDFCLTEFRVDATLPGTTNIALSCPVTASHSLWADMSPDVLTDGLPGSFNHPAEAGLGDAFHFEIDLGSIRTIDHIALRGRADGYALDRLTRVRMRLYDRPVEPGVKPVWESMDREDGSHPDAGSIDIIQVAGRGLVRGRYLRISSDSKVPLSPQIAEVEVYEKITPAVVTTKADGRLLPRGNELRVPPGTTVFAATLNIPGTGLPENLPIRWRLRGLHDDWQTAQNLNVEMHRPPPGEYHFEAQVGHSDGEWDTSMLSLPVTVMAPFWKTPVFYGIAAALSLTTAFAIMRAFERRRRARELAVWQHETALVEERRRIARDMHDEVGARLSQLALMQDLVIRQHPMPESARQSLRELATNTRQTVDALDQVVWAVNPLNDTLAGVADYLPFLATSYLSPLEITCRLDAPIDWPEIDVRAQARHEITLAFREALQNIAKHSGAESATLILRYEAPEFVIRLADDGRGLPEEFSGPGKDGLANMQSRLASIGGLCVIRCREGGGTEVEMRLPLPPLKS
jgi:signal transduction histidine kinase